MKPLSYKQAAQQALDIQNACNGSGIVFAFAKAMQAVCDEANRTGQGTDWKNSNPIVTLFLLKLSELNGCGSTLDATYGPAELACQEIAAQPDAPTVKHLDTCYNVQNCACPLG